MIDNDRSILLFTSTTHALVHIYELSIPIFMLAWLAELPVSRAVLGTVVAVGYGLFGLGALPGGMLADRFGSHRLVIGCLLGMGTAFLLLSFASDVLTIALALGVWGLAASVYHPSGLSLISTGVKQRGRGFAYHGMAGNTGIAFGPLVTALLLLRFDWQLVAAILGTLAILASLVAVRLEFEPMAAVETDGGERTAAGSADADSPETGPLRRFLADSRQLFTVAFALAFCIACATGLFYRGTLTFLPDVLGTYLPDITEVVQLFEPGTTLAERFDLAAYLYAGLLVVGIGGQYVGGRLTDRVRPAKGLLGLYVPLVLISVAFVPAAEAGLLPLLLVSAALGFTLFALQPLYQAMIAENSPANDRGLSYGYTYLAVFGVGAAGAAIAGTLLTITSVQGTFTALAAIPAIAAVLAFTLSRR